MRRLDFLDDRLGLAQASKQPLKAIRLFYNRVQPFTIFFILDFFFIANLILKKQLTLVGLL